ncbi:hypothetical protein K0F38_18365 [Bacteroides fragilis]|nr:hypothetical protein [Bacteroides fragilis]MCE8655325.1 hypothetical protein [Bacteroides fragilis]MCY1134097.1 hypothetical protein [Bacteroides fragilis]
MGEQEKLIDWTTVKVYLRDEQGNEDYFITPIRLTEEDARCYYLNHWWNMGIEYDHMMLCYKVEIIKGDKSNEKSIES